MVEGEFLAVQSLPRPKSKENFVIAERFNDYASLIRFLELENFIRDYSHLTACQERNGEIIRMDGRDWEFAEPEIYECICGASLTQSEVNEGYCPVCYRDV